MRARHDQNRAIQAARDAALSRSSGSSTTASDDGSSPYESERSRPLVGSSPYQSGSSPYGAGSSGTPPSSSSSSSSSSYHPTHGSPPYAGRPGTPPSSAYDTSIGTGSSGSASYAASSGSSGTPSSNTGEYASNAYSDDVARYSRRDNGSSSSLYSSPIYDNAGPSPTASLNNVRTPEPTSRGGGGGFRGSYSGRGGSSSSGESVPVSEAIPSISDDYVRRVVVSRQTSPPPAQSSVVYAGGNQTSMGSTSMMSSNRITSPAAQNSSPTTTSSGHKAAKISLQELPPDHDQDGIPGVAGKDYPTLTEIPKTSFSCGRQPLNGYYADTGKKSLF